MAKTLLLDYDTAAENPLQWDGWKLYSFNRDHKSYEDREKFFPDGRPTLGLRSKLKAGTAFVLDYSEHGLCQWGVAGTIGMPAWDSTHGAGLLVWEGSLKDLGPKTYEDRRKDAVATCEVYTEWCNGSVYGFRVEDEDGNDIESSYGFYDVGKERLSEMISQIQAALGGDADVEISGPAAWLADHHDFLGRQRHTA